MDHPPEVRPMARHNAIAITLALMELNLCRYEAA
jgi:hypothetical protein